MLRGEGIVQITNLKGVAKAIVISITDWSQVQVLLGPPFNDKIINNFLKIWVVV